MGVKQDVVRSLDNGLGGDIGIGMREPGVRVKGSRYRDEISVEVVERLML